MIAGGTEKPGVPPSIFRMPEGLSIRYDQPAPELGDAITGYHVYASTLPGEQEDWFLPGTANVRVTLDAGPITYTVRRRTYHPLPDVALFGPTSQAMRAITRGGTMIGFGVSALGWSRLFPGSASDYANRAVPLGNLVSPAFVDDLRRTLAATDREHGVKPALDAFLARHLRPPHRDAVLIRQLMALLGDERIGTLSQLAAELGVPGHTLRRIAVRHFGFPPKLLLLRARFIRSFTRLVREGDVLAYSLIDRSYYDASHFLRDARTFLGTTPRRFMARPTTFLTASLRARNAVLGAPSQVLHPFPRDPLDGPDAAP